MTGAPELHARDYGCARPALQSVQECTVITRPKPNVGRWPYHRWRGYDSYSLSAGFGSPVVVNDSFKVASDRPPTVGDMQPSASCRCLPPAGRADLPVG